MKRSSINKLTAILTAALIASLPLSAVAYAATDAMVTDPPANVKEVKNGGNLVKGELSVTIPDGIAGTYTVKAYEILRLVIPKDSSWPDTEGTPDPMSNNNKNLYVVTDNFESMFSDMKTAYFADSAAGGELRAATMLYITYNDSTQKLQAATSAPAGDENVKYVKISNASGSKLDQTFFEADIISRLTGSNVNPGETEAAAVRLFSDWASRYVKSKSLTESAAAVLDQTTPSAKKYVFKGDNKLVYGYHLIVTTDASSNSNTPALNQNILNVPNASNVRLKASPVTIDKSVSNQLDENNHNNGSAGANTASARYDKANGTKYDKVTSNIGDVNHYVVESHIPSYTSFDLDLASSNTQNPQLLTLDTELTNANVDTVTNGKYVYVFRDKMEYQDFIPVDLNNSKYGSAVDGLRVKVKAGNGLDEVTYLVRDFSATQGEHEYHLVPTVNSEKTTSIGRLWETDYTAETHSNFFAINFDMKKLKAENLDGRDVEISYNAELMGEATSSANTNAAKIRYSNDPFNASTYSTINDTTNVYTYDVVVDKKFSDGSTTENYGKVKFKLYSDSGKQHPIYFVQKTEGSTAVSGSYIRSDSDDASANKTLELSISTTDGKLTLHGLGEGTYYLEEQESSELAAKGFNTLDTITIVVSAKTDATTITDTTDFKLFSSATPAVTGSDAIIDSVHPDLTSASDGYGIEFEVVNQKGFVLPLTGEMGNWLMAIGGILLVAIGGTVIVLANRKKKENVSDK